MIVVARDDRLARSLRAAVSPTKDIRIVGPCRDVAQVSDLVTSRSTAVAVADLDGHDDGAMKLVSEIRDLAGMPVLVAGLEAGSEVLARALTAGACGILPPPEDPARVLEAVRRAAAGELVLPDSGLSAIVDRLRPPVDRLDVLTQRERQTLHLLAEGLSTGDVARHLGISPATVQTHVKNVLAKLGVHSKVQAVRVALLAGV